MAMQAGSDGDGGAAEVVVQSVRTNVQYLVVHTIHFRCGHLGQPKELDTSTVEFVSVSLFGVSVFCQASFFDPCRSFPYTLVLHSTCTYPYQ